MPYAKSMEELVDMLELLLPELASIGLELNVSKTQISNACLEEPRVAEVAGDFMEILHGERKHKS